MALKSIQTVTGYGQITTEFGTINSGVQTYSNTFYVKVESIQGDKVQQVAGVVFKIGDAECLRKQYAFQPDLESSKNFIAQAYDHLKSLPEFAGAEDC